MRVLAKPLHARIAQVLGLLNLAGATGGLRLHTLLRGSTKLAGTAAAIPALAVLGSLAPAAAPLLAHDPAARRVLPFDKRGAGRGLHGLGRMAAVLAGERYRVAYLAQDSVRTALLARLARIPSRIGFADAPGRWWYTERRSRRGAHRLYAWLDVEPASMRRFPLNGAAVPASQ